MIETQLIWAALAAFAAMFILRRFLRPRQPTEYDKELHKVLNHPEYKVRGKFE